MSIFHAWGWCNLQLALATGSTLIARRCFDPDTEASDLARYGVNGIISAAVFLRDLLATVDERGLDASEVRYVVTAGSTIPPTLVNALNERFGDGCGVVCNFYGSTEHGQISIGRIEDLLDHPTTAGRPVMGVRLAIIGEDGAPVPQGGTGTIYSSNSMTSLGFLSDKDSADVIDGMLSTGDTGFIDEAGRLYVCGRADDMVIRGGENVHPRTIEEFLLTLPEVRDAFVIGHQEDIVATLDAYVVLNAEISDDAINELVLTNVNEFSGLDHIVRVGALPRNESGKVVPRLLPQT
ncbi:AMP-binding protein [Corynebacterium vitaeruminis]|uniref:AMP-binding protein n=1 Tax=Corynebacterium vitaeruminis TaxID=38305 RepID=UPI0023F3296F|nr:AMP-binding protein [Corynebacterium vitaeruminis]